MRKKSIFTAISLATGAIVVSSCGSEKDEINASIFDECVGPVCSFKVELENGVYSTSELGKEHLLRKKDLPKATSIEEVTWSDPDAEGDFATNDQLTNLGLENCPDEICDANSNPTGFYFTNPDVKQDISVVIELNQNGKKIIKSANKQIVPSSQVVISANGICDGLTCTLEASVDKGLMLEADGDFGFVWSIINSSDQDVTNMVGEFVDGNTGDTVDFKFKQNTTGKYFGKAVLTIDGNVSSAQTTSLEYALLDFKIVENSVSGYTGTYSIEGETLGDYIQWFVNGVEIHNAGSSNNQQLPLAPGNNVIYAKAAGVKSSEITTKVSVGDFSINATCTGLTCAGSIKGLPNLADGQEYAYEWSSPTATSIDDGNTANPVITYPESVAGKDQAYSVTVSVSGVSDTSNTKSDTTKPTVPTIDIKADNYNADTYEGTFTVTTEEGNEVEWFVNNQPVLGVTGSTATLQLSPGENEVYAEVQDASGTIEHSRLLENTFAINDFTLSDMGCEGLECNLAVEDLYPESALGLNQTYEYTWTAIGTTKIDGQGTAKVGLTYPSDASGKEESVSVKVNVVDLPSTAKIKDTKVSPVIDKVSIGLDGVDGYVGTYSVTGLSVEENATVQWFVDGAEVSGAKSLTRQQLTLTPGVNVVTAKVNGVESNPVDTKIAVGDFSINATCTGLTCAGSIKGLPNLADGQEYAYEWSSPTATSIDDGNTANPVITYPESVAGKDQAYSVTVSVSGVSDTSNTKSDTTKPTVPTIDIKADNYNADNYEGTFTVTTEEGNEVEWFVNNQPVLGVTGSTATLQLSPGENEVYAEVQDASGTIEHSRLLENTFAINDFTLSDMGCEGLECNLAVEDLYPESALGLNQTYEYTWTAIGTTKIDGQGTAKVGLTYPSDASGKEESVSVKVNVVDLPSTAKIKDTKVSPVIDKVSIGLDGVDGYVGTYSVTGLSVEENATVQWFVDGAEVSGAKSLTRQQLTLTPGVNVVTAKVNGVESNPVDTKIAVGDFSINATCTGLTCAGSIKGLPNLADGQEYAYEWSSPTATSIDDGNTANPVITYPESVAGKDQAYSVTVSVSGVSDTSNTKSDTTKPTVPTIDIKADNYNADTYEGTFTVTTEEGNEVEWFVNNQPVLGVTGSTATLQLSPGENEVYAEVQDASGTIEHSRLLENTFAINDFTLSDMGCEGLECNLAVEDLYPESALGLNQTYEYTWTAIGTTKIDGQGTAKVGLTYPSDASGKEESVSVKVNVVDLPSTAKIKDTKVSPVIDKVSIGLDGVDGYVGTYSVTGLSVEENATVQWFVDGAEVSGAKSLTRQQLTLTPGVNVVTAKVNGVESNPVDTKIAVGDFSINATCTGLTCAGSIKGLPNLADGQEYAYEWSSPTATSIDDGNTANPVITYPESVAGKDQAYSVTVSVSGVSDTSNTKSDTTKPTVPTIDIKADNYNADTYEGTFTVTTEEGNEVEWFVNNQPVLGVTGSTATLQLSPGENEVYAEVQDASGTIEHSRLLENTFAINDFTLSDMGCEGLECNLAVEDLYPESALGLNQTYEYTWTAIGTTKIDGQGTAKVGLTYPSDASGKEESVSVKVNVVDLPSTAKIKDTKVSPVIDKVSIGLDGVDGYVGTYSVTGLSVEENATVQWFVDGAEVSGAKSLTRQQLTLTPGVNVVTAKVNGVESNPVDTKIAVGDFSINATCTGLTCAGSIKGLPNLADGQEYAYEWSSPTATSIDDGNTANPVITYPESVAGKDQAYSVTVSVSGVSDTSNTKSDTTKPTVPTIDIKADNYNADTYEGTFTVTTEEGNEVEWFVNNQPVLGVTGSTATLQLSPGENEVYAEVQDASGTIEHSRLLENTFAINDFTLSDMGCEGLECNLAVEDLYPESALGLNQTYEYTWTAIGTTKIDGQGTAKVGLTYPSDASGKEESVSVKVNVVDLPSTAKIKDTKVSPVIDKVSIGLDGVDGYVGTYSVTGLSVEENATVQWFVDGAEVSGAKSLTRQQLTLTPGVNVVTAKVNGVESNPVDTKIAVGDFSINATCTGLTCAGSIKGLPNLADGQEYAYEWSSPTATSIDDGNTANPVITYPESVAGKDQAYSVTVSVSGVSDTSNTKSDTTKPTVPTIDIKADNYNADNYEGTFTVTTEEGNEVEWFVNNQPVLGVTGSTATLQLSPGENEVYAEVQDASGTIEHSRLLENTFAINDFTLSDMGCEGLECNLAVEDLYPESALGLNQTYEYTWTAIGTTKIDGQGTAKVGLTYPSDASGKEESVSVKVNVVDLPSTAKIKDTKVSPVIDKVSIGLDGVDGYVGTYSVTGLSVEENATVQWFVDGAEVSGAKSLTRQQLTLTPGVNVVTAKVNGVESNPVDTKIAVGDFSINATCTGLTCAGSIKGLPNLADGQEYAYEWSSPTATSIDDGNTANPVITYPESVAGKDQAYSVTVSVSGVSDTSNTKSDTTKPTVPTIDIKADNYNADNYEGTFTVTTEEGNEVEWFVNNQPVLGVTGSTATLQLSPGENEVYAEVQDASGTIEHSRLLENTFAINDFTLSDMGCEGLECNLAVEDLYPESALGLNQTYEYTWTAIGTTKIDGQGTAKVGLTYPSDASGKEESVSVKVNVVDLPSTAKIKDTKVSPVIDKVSIGLDGVDGYVGTYSVTGLSVEENATVQWFVDGAEVSGAKSLTRQQLTLTPGVNVVTAKVNGVESNPVDTKIAVGDFSINATCTGLTCAGSIKGLPNLADGQEYAYEWSSPTATSIDDGNTANPVITYPESVAGKDQAYSVTVSVSGVSDTSNTKSDTTKPTVPTIDIKADNYNADNYEGTFTVTTEEGNEVEWFVNNQPVLGVTGSTATLQLSPGENEVYAEVQDASGTIEHSRLLENTFAINDFTLSDMGCEGLECNLAVEDLYPESALGLNQTYEYTWTAIGTTKIDGQGTAKVGLTYPSDASGKEESVSVKVNVVDLPSTAKIKDTKVSPVIDKVSIGLDGVDGYVGTYSVTGLSVEENATVQWFVDGAEVSGAKSLTRQQLTLTPGVNVVTAKVNGVESNPVDTKIAVGDFSINATCTGLTCAGSIKGLPNLADGQEYAYEWSSPTATSIDDGNTANPVITYPESVAGKDQAYSVTVSVSGVSDTSNTKSDTTKPTVPTIDIKADNYNADTYEGTFTVTTEEGNEVEWFVNNQPVLGVTGSTATLQLSPGENEVYAEVQDASGTIEHSRLLENTFAINDFTLSDMGCEGLECNLAVEDLYPESALGLNQTYEYTWTAIGTTKIDGQGTAKVGLTYPSDASGKEESVSVKVNVVDLPSTAKIKDTKVSPVIDKVSIGLDGVDGYVGTYSVTGLSVEENATVQWFVDGAEVSGAKSLTRQQLTLTPGVNVVTAKVNGVESNPVDTKIAVGDFSINATCTGLTCAGSIKGLPNLADGQEYAYEWSSPTATSIDDGNTANPVITYPESVAGKDQAYSVTVSVSGVSDTSNTKSDTTKPTVPTIDIKADNYNADNYEGTFTVTTEEGNEVEWFVNNQPVLGVTGSTATLQLSPGENEVYAEVQDASGTIEHSRLLENTFAINDFTLSDMGCEGLECNLAVEDLYPESALGLNQTYEYTWTAIGTTKIDGQGTAKVGLTYPSDASGKEESVSVKVNVVDLPSTAKIKDTKVSPVIDKVSIGLDGVDGYVGTYSVTGLSVEENATVQWFVDGAEVSGAKSLTRQQLTLTPGVNVVTAKVNGVESNPVDTKIAVGDFSINATCTGLTCAGSIKGLPNLADGQEYAYEWSSPTATSIDDGNTANPVITYPESVAGKDQAYSVTVSVSGVSDTSNTKSDTTKPTVPTIDIKADNYNADTYEGTFTVTTEEGNEVEWFVNNQPVLGVTGSTATLQLSPGENEVYAEVQDASGTIEHSRLLENTFAINDFTLSDMGCEGLECNLAVEDLYPESALGLNQTYEYTWTAIGTTKIDGQGTAKVGLTYPSDASGKEESVSVKVNVVDLPSTAKIKDTKVSPVIDKVSIGLDGVDGYVGTYSVTGLSVEENATVQWFVDGAEVSGAKSLTRQQLTLTPGVNVVTAKVNGVESNPVDTKIAVGDFSINATCTGLTCAGSIKGLPNLADGQEYAYEWSSPTATSIDDGNTANPVITYPESVAGKDQAYSVTVSVSGVSDTSNTKSDTTKPTVPTIDIKADNYNADTYEGTFTVTTEEGNEVEWFVNNQPVLGVTGSTATLQLSPGENEVYAEVQDASGTIEHSDLLTHEFAISDFTVEVVCDGLSCDGNISDLPPEGSLGFGQKYAYKWYADTAKNIDRDATATPTIDYSSKYIGQKQIVSVDVSVQGSKLVNNKSTTATPKAVQPEIEYWGNKGYKARYTISTDTTGQQINWYVNDQLQIDDGEKDQWLDLAPGNNKVEVEVAGVKSEPSETKIAVQPFSIVKSCKGELTCTASIDIPDAVPGSSILINWESTGNPDISGQYTENATLTFPESEAGKEQNLKATVSVVGVSGTEQSSEETITPRKTTASITANNYDQSNYTGEFTLTTDSDNDVSWYVNGEPVLGVEGTTATLQLAPGNNEVYAEVENQGGTVVHSNTESHVFKINDYNLSVTPLSDDNQLTFDAKVNNLPTLGLGQQYVYEFSATDAKVQQTDEYTDNAEITFPADKAGTPEAVNVSVSVINLPDTVKTKSETVTPVAQQPLIVDNTKNPQSTYKHKFTVANYADLKGQSVQWYVNGDEVPNATDPIDQIIELTPGENNVVAKVGGVDSFPIPVNMDILDVVADVDCDNSLTCHGNVLDLPEIPSYSTKEYIYKWTADGATFDTSTDIKEPLFTYPESADGTTPFVSVKISMGGVEKTKESIAKPVLPKLVISQESFDESTNIGTYNLVTSLPVGNDVKWYLSGTVATLEEGSSAEKAVIKLLPGKNEVEARYENKVSNEIDTIAKVLNYTMNQSCSDNSCTVSVEGLPNLLRGQSYGIDWQSDTNPDINGEDSAMAILTYSDSNANGQEKNISANIYVKGYQEDTQREQNIKAYPLYTEIKETCGDLTCDLEASPIMDTASYEWRALGDTIEPTEHGHAKLTLSGAGKYRVSVNISDSNKKVKSYAEKNDEIPLEVTFSGECSGLNCSFTANPLNANPNMTSYKWTVPTSVVESYSGENSQTLNLTMLHFEGTTRYIAMPVTVFSGSVAAFGEVRYHCIDDGDNDYCIYDGGGMKSER